ncbi:MAG TPA: acetyl-CoA carboxylase carboxyl transferase subunit beta, partial [Aquificaceae bacterium]|nr:acetyl-CoA carboxylase carboxyl transferase subunit beta [Aquificaceae bacterium]
MGIFDKFLKKRKEEENLWTKCPECRTLLYVPDLRKNLRVCPKCGYHFPLSAEERAHQLLEEGSERLFEDIQPMDPLGFKDTKPYRDRLKRAREQTGLSEAMLVLKGKIDGREVILASMDFGFI